MMRVWIHCDAYAVLVDEASRAYPNETGGVLVGYRGDNGEAVIHAVVGPGPDATHSTRRFVPDHAWQCSQLDALFALSTSNWVYVGDWHTHPDGMPEMSWLDRRTLRRIAKYPNARTAHPMMLIGGGTPECWDWKIHEYRGDRIFGALIDTCASELTCFD